MGFKIVRFRSRILPRTYQDWGMFIFTLLVIPIVFIYELCVVLPVTCHGHKVIYCGIIFFGLFVFVNIVANFVGLVVTDTSVPREVMTMERVSKQWEFCCECVSYVPPRAWHCKVCRVCILKRDHHCSFSSYCVGHYNHRFFIMFIMFLNIGTMYCVISETIFLLFKVEFWTILSLVKLFLPLCAIILGLETLQNEMYIVIYNIVCLTFAFTCILLHFHMKIILNGQVTHDKTIKNFQYNNGKVLNIKQVLGERWYFAWVFPFISSDLPCDGISWQTGVEWRLEVVKNSLKER